MHLHIYKDTPLLLATKKGIHFGWKSKKKVYSYMYRTRHTPTFEVIFGEKGASYTRIITVRSGADLGFGQGSWRDQIRTTEPRWFWELHMEILLQCHGDQNFQRGHHGSIPGHRHNCHKWRLSLWIICVCVSLYVRMTGISHWSIQLILNCC